MPRALGPSWGGVAVLACVALFATSCGSVSTGYTSYTVNDEAGFAGRVRFDCLHSRRAPRNGGRLGPEVPAAAEVAVFVVGIGPTDIGLAMAAADRL